MDESSRRIVRFVTEFDESRLTASVVAAFNRTMIDSMAAIISGFEEEPVRIAARVAQDAQPAPGRMKATVFGYGVSTTPELAAFANGVQVRMTDFNDNPHTSNIIPGILAIGEALHSTGPQVMTAIIIGYEISRLGAGESIAPAMGAGKLMGLDEDRLANALTIALTPHVALNKGEGALSMWKGVRSAEATKCGIWAAILARAGMTGPPQPFEGPGALWSRNGRREVTLPVEDKLAIELNWFKARPAEASSQGTLTLVPEMRAWTRPEEIASIQYDMNDLGEISDAPKFDPQNRETADHSMPFILARALLDGDVYMDSFTDPAKRNDPAARALMSKMTFGKVEGWSGLGPARITIRKTNGEERTWDTYGGVRQLTLREYPRMTDEQITAKFNRACAYQKIDDARRDRIRTVWGDLHSLTDIAEAIQAVATFGNPKPL
jgi:2-methylcitrate dehydratase